MYFVKRCAQCPKKSQYLLVTNNEVYFKDQPTILCILDTFIEVKNSFTIPSIMIETLRSYHVRAVGRRAYQHSEFMNLLSVASIVPDLASLTVPVSRLSSIRVVYRARLKKDRDLPSKATDTRIRELHVLYLATRELASNTGILIPISQFPMQSKNVVPGFEHQRLCPKGCDCTILDFSYKDPGQTHNRRPFGRVYPCSDQWLEVSGDSQSATKEYSCLA